MENVKPWQYLVIAGPAFLAGIAVWWAICHEYIRGLEDIVLYGDDDSEGHIVTDSELSELE